MRFKRIVAATICAALASAGILIGCSNAQTVTQPASSAQTTSEATRTVTNSDGAEVTIPSVVTKVAPDMGAFAQVTEMLTQGNGKISAAATKQVSDFFKQVCPDYTASNPQGYNVSSVEDIIASGTQVVYGPSSIFTDEQLAQLSEAGVAFVKLDNIKTVDGMCESILTIGKILGDDEYALAQKFVAYYKASMTDAAQRTASLSADQKKTVMELGYSGGTYTTINKTDICNEYITAAGATNVAADYSGATSGNALTVDAEQIAAWNPDVVICMSQEAKSAFMSDPALTQCKAVQNNTVYVIPTGTYLWSVRSGEGALMTPWLGTVVYPEQFSDVNMTTLVKDFFSTYYRYTLSDAEAATILAGSATVSAPK